MDTKRLILLFVFVFSTFMLVDGWQRDQHAREAINQLAKKGSADSGIPSAPTVPSAPSSVPTAPTGVAPAVPGKGVPAAPAQGGVLPAGPLVKVETDLFKVEISTQGGDIRQVELKQHKSTFDTSKNFVLMQTSPDHTYIAQSGLIGDGLPNHHTRYEVKSRDYTLADGAQTLEVRLEAPEINGVKVAQVYTFTRDSYLIDVAYEVDNGSAKALTPYGYFQLVRDRKLPDGDSRMLPTYTGAAVYTNVDKFKKVTFDDIDKSKVPYSKDSQDEGWVAMLQHYFMGAFLPKGKMPREFYTHKVDGDLYAAGVVVTGSVVAAGQKSVLDVPLYVGPEEIPKLEALAPNLERVVDFGMLTVIASPMFTVLTWIHSWVGNWGIAIILLTLMLKMLFYPLQEASYKAMAKMKIIAPKMQQLKERYGNDKQRLQKATMELYQKEKVNPMAGCLPIIVQMPVFISLYWVILASVELRHAPFYGWIHDLSAVDPWYVLPVLMGISMIVQSRLNPVPPDPVQAKMMKIMPLAFSVFFFFFPAGLVLYWLVNNVLSISQQWFINHRLGLVGNDKIEKK